MNSRIFDCIFYRLIALSLLIITIFGEQSFADTETRDLQTGNLVVLRWRADALGQTAFGSACWLEVDKTGWRLSIADNGPASLNDKSCLVQTLNEIGDGWTVVPSESGSAVVMPWRDQFSDFGRRVSLYLELAMTLLAKGPYLAVEDIDASVEILGSARKDRRIDTLDRVTDISERPVVQRLLLPPGWADNPFQSIKDRLKGKGVSSGRRHDSFRKRMEHRGRGRGDDRETWRLDWSESDSTRVLTIKSSRRIGELVLERVAVFPVSFDPEDILVPIWSLAELLVMQEDI